LLKDGHWHALAAEIFKAVTQFLMKSLKRPDEQVRRFPCCLPSQAETNGHTPGCRKEGSTDAELRHAIGPLKGCERLRGSKNRSRWTSEDGQVGQTRNRHPNGRSDSCNGRAFNAARITDRSET